MAEQKLLDTGSSCLPHNLLSEQAKHAQNFPRACVGQSMERRPPPNLAVLSGGCLAPAHYQPKGLREYSLICSSTESVSTVPAADPGGMS